MFSLGEIANLKIRTKRFSERGKLKFHTKSTFTPQSDNGEYPGRDGSVRHN